MAELNDINYHAASAPDRIGLIEAQVAALSEQLGRLLPPPAAEVAKPLTVPDRWPLPQPTSFARGRSRVVRSLLRQRRMRDRHFASDLFADPAWDMLLDLYAAHYEGRSVSVSSLCIAAAVPATTALRWISLMEKEGHFLRSSDPNDGRRIFICLSEDARTRMDGYFDETGD
ncbi:MAG: hypothetical protein ACTHJU_04030 [Sphingopyxis sp.]